LAIITQIRASNNLLIVIESIIIIKLINVIVLLVWTETWSVTSKDVSCIGGEMKKFALAGIVWRSCFSRRSPREPLRVHADATFSSSISSARLTSSE
jgi:hypothetical protein